MNQTPPASLIYASVTDDPADSFTLGTKLILQPSLIQIPLLEGHRHLENWAMFNGIVLGIVVGQPGSERLCGSAVLVAPGVALAACHVVREHVDDIMNGRTGIWCAGLTANGVEAWEVRTITMPSHADIAILGLKRRSAMPTDHVLQVASITTRVPRLGERLLLAGFVDPQVLDDVSSPDSLEHHISSSMRASAGQVIERHALQRDRVMMPWSCVRVDCNSVGGMSGGPVFDHRGLLVGLLSSSFETEEQTGPSYVSLLWPALTTKFEGGWPTGMMSGKRSLLELDRRLCSIERPEAVREVLGATPSDTYTEYDWWE